MLNEREQILAFVRRHAQRGANALEHVGRNLDPAALLEPRVPRDTDARERRNVLAPEARRSPPVGIRQPYLAWREPRPAALEKIDQVSSVGIHSAVIIAPIVPPGERN